MSLLSKAARLFGGKSARPDLLDPEETTCDTDWASLVVDRYRSHQQYDAEDERRKIYQSHEHDRDTAMLAALHANSTQEVHRQREKARAATCAMMVMELEAGRFDYLPTPEVG